MNIKAVGDKIIAETSSKGNQEKWLENNIWYKLDQFGYEALSEVLISRLLEKCSFNKDFKFVKYEMVRAEVHGKARIGCMSENFLKENQSIITVNRLIANEMGKPAAKALADLRSDVKRLEFLASFVGKITKLEHFGEYLTFMFEADALFLNEDRHLNNIAVLYENGRFEYCPIFDNGAGLLSDTRSYRYDIEPKALSLMVKAQPFNISFNRQVNNMRKLYGSQLRVCFDKSDIEEAENDLLLFYPERDRGLIKDRVEYCILTQMKKLWEQKHL